MWILLTLDINVWRLVLRYFKNPSVTVMLQLETKVGNAWSEDRLINVGLIH
jgi:hypothetical protein